MLAVAGIFSATAVAFNKQVNEQPVAEKAEARSASDRIYLAYNGTAQNYYDSSKNYDWDNGGYKPYAYFYNSSNTGQNNGWPGVVMTKMDNDVYYTTLGNSSYNSVIFVCYNGSSIAHDGRDNVRSTWDGATPISIPSDLSKKNCFFLKKYNCPTGTSSDCGSWDRHPGWYVIGSGVNGSASWSTDTMVAADATTVDSTNNKASWTNITLSATAEFKVTYFEKSQSRNDQSVDLAGYCSGIGISGGGTGGANITSSVNRSNYKIFFTQSNKVSVNVDFTITYYENKDGATSSSKSTTGNSDILLSETLSGKFGTYTGYSITGYYTNAALTQAVTLSSTRPTAAMSVYAKYEVNTYTITYYKVMNGLYMDWWGTSTVSARHFQKYSDIEPAEIYGYGFEGWYSDSSCNTGIGSNTITGNATVYAKYTSDPSNNTYYVGLPSGDCYNNVTYGGTLRVYYSNGTEDVKDAPAHHIAGITSTNLYLVSIPSDVTWFAFHSGLSNYSMQSGHRTVSVGPDTGYDPGSNNLFLCKNETTTAYDGGQTEYVGEWTTCYFQFQTASNSTFSSNLSKVDMSEPSNMSSGNDAEAIGVAGTASYYFRIAVVINGSENYLTTVGTDANTSSCTASSGSNRFKASNLTINVYLKDNVIYLLDTSDIDAGGYLYISCGDSLTDIKITVAIKNSSGTTVYPFSSSKLSTVTSTTNTNTLTFNSVEGLIRIPIYNLRGELTPDKSKQDYYSVTFNSNSAVNVPILTTKTDYYMSSLSATPTTTSAPAASVAYDFDAAVSNASNKSVCNIDTTTAKSICGKYDALSSTEKGTFSSASISTWNSTKPTYSGNQDAPMTAILYQVSRIANDGVSRGSLGLFGHFGLFGDSESSMSTIIIVISSSVALLSVTALSILVIRKRKSKEIE